MARRRCYCVYLWTNHRQGARGCGLNADGSERALCGGCGLVDLFKSPRHNHGAN
jgi:hypothetical protein